MRAIVPCLCKRLLNPPTKLKFLFFCSRIVSTTCSTKCQAESDSESQSKPPPLTSSLEVLRRWGCSEDDILKMLSRRPSLRNANASHLQSKLKILSDLGLTGPDLVKVINCRPRFLSCQINAHLDERLNYLLALFGGSRELLRKAIIRNPSFLTYSFHSQMKPAIALYEHHLGLSREDLVPMLISRPTMIPRSSFEEEKLEYIRRTHVSPSSKMYKHVVTIIGISRLETIREKVANFDKFGFSEDEVLRLFGQSPLLMTLSVDKVQRNMTFILGTMKLPAQMVIQNPFLLYSNLDSMMRPRVLLLEKLQDLGLLSRTIVQGSNLLRPLRMEEKRFIETFVKCHPEDVANELMDFYRSVKGVKRLAEASKKNIRKGFPF